MTQDQAGYLTDALEMMGIVEPKQIVTEVSGFIPVFEVVLHHYKDYMTALVFGRMWQYCGMKDGVCKATIEKLAQDLEMSTATVMRHIELLEEGGYIYDQTPERRNRPHEYVDCGKVVMKGSLSAISQKNVRPSQNNVALSESQLIKQDNTNIKQDDSILAKYKAMQADPLQALLDMENFPGAKKRVRVDSVLSYLGATLRKNVTSREWREFAEYVDSEHQSKGWEVTRFIEWMYGQKNFDLQYWPVKKMRENYPAAFIEKTDVNNSGRTIKTLERDL